MKKTISLILLITLSFSAFAFDWPQDNVDSKSFTSYFGQNRGGKISSSVVFNNTDDVKASENGKVLMIMLDVEDENSFFPSTLGTSLIIAHDDQLLSVYGNLDENTIDSTALLSNDIEAGEVIGKTGNQAYKNNDSKLEFQIIDTKKETAINPKLLITRTNSEIDLIITDIFIENKNHDFFQLQNNRNFPAGNYRIYQKRNSIACPYKTTITVNGVQLDQISYDTINQENNKIFVSGKKKYISSDIYPNSNLQLLGETVFSPGKSTLGLSSADFLGKTKNLNYIISVY